jgi:hypothetical protein
MHRVFEVHSNIHGDKWATVPCNGPHTSPDQAVAPELLQFDEWLKDDWVAEMGLVPWRTEFSVFYTSNRTGNFVVCAGQIDMVARDKEGNFYIIDWKRVDPKYDLSISATAYKGKMACNPIISHLPVTKYNQYSAQASAYSVCMEQMENKAGPWDTGNQLYILRLHHKIAGGAQFIHCADLRTEVRSLLEEL